MPLEALLMTRKPIPLRKNANKNRFFFPACMRTLFQENYYMIFAFCNLFNTPIWQCLQSCIHICIVIVL